MLRNHVLTLALLASLTLAGCESGPKPGAASSTPEAIRTPQAQFTPPAPVTPQVSGPNKPGLTPLPGVKAPKLDKVVKIKFTTTKGEFVVEIYPLAAPNAAKRFEELVKARFFDGTPIFRVIPGFVAQFGLNSEQKQWATKHFKDDPSLFFIEQGSLAFAKAGPNTNSSQVFINYRDNSPLISQGGFTAFGKVVSGYEHTQFKSVGNPNDGLDQGALLRDTKGYLATLPDKPDMILKAEVLPAEKATATPTPDKGGKGK